MGLTTNPSLIKSTVNAPGISDHAMVVTDADQNQNSLLVKRQNDNTSPGDWPRKISP